MIGVRGMETAVGGRVTGGRMHMDHGQNASHTLEVNLKLKAEVRDFRMSEWRG